MKNRITALITVFAMLLVFLCSCTKADTIQSTVIIDDKVAEYFSDCITIDEIFKDVKNIDLYYKPDTSALKSETIRDKENDTADVYWKDSKGKTVYKFYEGYGEKLFDYFTKSKSGRDITVQYWDNDGERYDISVKCDDYCISFCRPNTDSKYGADDIGICIYKNKDSLLNESINYGYTKNRWTVYPCFYLDNEGYKEYWTYYDDGTKKIESCTNIIHTHCTAEPKCHDEMLTDPLLTFKPEFVIPAYKLSYLGTPDEGQWFITADFVLSFESEEAKNAYKEKYNLSGSETQGNEYEYLTLRTGEITVPLAKDFEGLSDFVNLWDVNDSYYKAVNMNGQGEISSFFSSGAFSYY